MRGITASDKQVNDTNENRIDAVKQNILRTTKTNKKMNKLVFESNIKIK